MSNEGEIERLLHEAAEEIRVAGGVPGRMRRGIRIRRLATAATSLVVASSLVAGGVVFVTSFDEDEELPPLQPTAEILITRDALSLPDGCGVRDSVSKLLSVTEGMNEGDIDTIESSLATGNHFSGVDISDPHGTATEQAMDREAVMTYLRDRIYHDDSYRVTKATVTNQPGPGTYPTNMTRVDFLAIRTADDIEGAIEYRGWAKVDCPTGRITMVNLGHRHLGEAVDTWCPPAPFGTPPDVVVGCSQDSSDRSTIVFPVQSTPGGRDARTHGRLLQRRRCLVVESVSDNRAYLPLWLPGYSYQLDDDGDVVVLDEKGNEVAKEGERVILGGARVEDGQALPEEVQRVVQHCGGPYWLTSDVSRPGGSR